MPVSLTDKGTGRRLVLLIGAIVFVDTMFYAVIAPILPTLAHHLHLSKLSAGVMTAAYPVGTFIGSLPGGLLTVRIGQKRTVYVGLGLLAGSTLAFGWFDDVASLDAARLIEGIGGACSWAGALAWLVTAAPSSRRGGAIGAAVGAAIAGALFGPVIGTIASAIGRGPTFSAVVILAVLLIAQTRRMPLIHKPSQQRLRDIGATLSGTGAVRAIWLVVLPSTASGVVAVLGPLRLHRLGADAVDVGATFLTASAIEAVLSPLVGRLSDRRGRLLPLRFGLAGAAAALACFTLPRTVLALSGLVVGIAAMLAFFWAPALAMLSEAAESGGLEQGFAAALVNAAWAAGQAIGAFAGGAVANAAGDAVPMEAAAGLSVLTLLLVGSSRRRGRERGVEVKQL